MKLFKVATFNTNSVRTRLPQILRWLEKETPDVLCLQETKVQDADFPAEPFRQAGYYVVFRGQKARAGVAIVSRDEPREVAYGLDDGEAPDEARLIRAVIEGIPIVNTYVPQGRSIDSPEFQYKLRWLERLRAFFARHYSPDEPLLWLGDFNVAPEPIDVHNPVRLKNHVDFHPEVRAALARIREWGFEDIFRRHHPDEPGQYTFWDYRVRQAVERNIGWRVDHIWATKPLAAKSRACWIDVQERLAERPSDHTFLVAEFEL
ncbi:MAG: exodeoxyribonuclease III [Anaerolineae bacterium]|nr:exodeoxyribonuclease III [Anaerolineae bacterium]